MSKKRPSTRWTSIRRTRRLVARGRSVRRHRWWGPTPWTHAVGLGGQDQAPKPDPLPAQSPACAHEQALPAFVELFPPLAAPLSHCTIEWEEPSGTKMTISLRGSSEAELLALIESLRSVRG